MAHLHSRAREPGIEQKAPSVAGGASMLELPLNSARRHLSAACARSAVHIMAGADFGHLTETPAMLAFVAQSYPGAGLAPLDDPFAFAQVQAPTATCAPRSM